MNRIIIMIAFLFAGYLAAGQQRPLPVTNRSSEPLTEGARMLFHQSGSRLLPAEKNALFQDLGLEVSPDKKAFRYKQMPVTVRVYPTDLNRDGVEEVFVELEGSLFGDEGCTTALFIKSDGHGYQQQEEIRGGTPLLLDTGSGGYPDLVIAGPDFEFPVYRWNGKAYVHRRTMSDDELQNAQTRRVEEYSRAYKELVRNDR